MKRRKSVTLLSGNENMVLSSEKNIISGSGTNIKMEAAKEYDLTTRTGTLNGTNLVIEAHGGCGGFGRNGKNQFVIRLVMGASASVIQEYYKAVDYWADIAGNRDWKLSVWIVGQNDVDLVDRFWK